MSNPIAVVAEAPEDFQAATMLIDETLVRTVEWISPSDIDTHRTFVGRSDAESFVKWQHIEVDRSSDYRRAVRRTFGARLPRHVVQLRIQRIIYEFTIQSSETNRPSPFVVIVKDTDGQDDAREALQEARAQFPDVVIGMQHTELECWLIAGFEPQSAAETSRLAEICRGEGPGVGFDPRARSEDLTATNRDNEKLSPKRVLKYLTDDDRSRALKGLGDTPHQVLKNRGERNGLADFLIDVERRLVRVVFNVHVANSSD